MVYLDSEYCSDVKTANIKLKKRWIGPLKIQAVLDDSHYLISDWNGEIPAIPMHIHRLKPYMMNMGLFKDGQLVAASTVRQLFSRLKEMRANTDVAVKSSEIQSCAQSTDTTDIDQEIQDIVTCFCHYCEWPVQESQYCQTNNCDNV